jgi:hypothetical protein
MNSFRLLSGFVPRSHCGSWSSEGQGRRSAPAMISRRCRRGATPTRRCAGRATTRTLQSKHQQGLRQLKFIINKGVEADLYTAQGFEALSGALMFAVNGAWEIDDADKGAGMRGFQQKNELWQTRRRLAMNFWVDQPGTTAATENRRR